MVCPEALGGASRILPRKALGEASRILTRSAKGRVIVSLQGVTRAAVHPLGQGRLRGPLPQGLLHHLPEVGRNPLSLVGYVVVLDLDMHILLSEATTRIWYPLIWLN